VAAETAAGQTPPARPLLVVVPGLSRNWPAWKPLIDRLSGEPALKDARWLQWEHGIALFSTTHPEQLANDLRARIGQEWKAHGPFSKVILIGHSFGGLLVRRAYLLATGADQTGERSPWAAAVSRIVLFAAINRGVNAHLTWRFWLVSWLARMFPPAQRFTRTHCFRGSDFIANLRIEWIRHFASLRDKAPVVVQLLGTKDTLVSRDDSIDVEQFPTACYLSIPDADHRTVYRLDLAPDPDGRYALIREAVLEPQPPHGVNRSVPGPSRVVFVLHGIRASNNDTWVKQTVEAIGRRWPDVTAIGSGYGFLSALAFAIPMTRRKNLRWFQDAYTEALALNPLAKFGFVGHSNGTYLFGESLKRLPGMQFEHAVLVGSVLPADYDWNERVLRGQIESLRVDGSCYDWPVGWLCSALRGIGMRDVGTGGFDGFTSFGGPSKREYFWYKGGHSRPLEAHNLAALAEFAVTGKAPAPSQIGAEVAWFATMSRVARRVSPLVLAAAVAGLGFLLWSWLTAGLVAIGALVVVLFVLDVG
jgi:hypothetical protein